MRRVVEPQRSLPWSRLVVSAALAVGMAGCSSETTRFENPFANFDNPFASSSQPAPAEVTGSVYPKTSSSVQSTPLPPPSGAAIAPAPQPVYAQPQPGYAPQPAYAQQPGYVPPPAGGRAMASYQPAPPPPQRTAARAPAGAQHVHVVAHGETLMQLSRRYGVPVVTIARANNLAPSALVKVGDRVVIPGVRAQQTAAPAAAPVAPPPIATVPSATAPKPVAPAPKVAAAPVTTSARMVAPVAEPATPEKTKAEVTSAMPTFRWPVHGRVIANFGSKPSGQQNDGINVAVPEGTPIKAAEDGVVAYAGNELKTYGNLVLVRHANGYVTAYAHASEILVKRDDPIKRGQVIAKSGQTGSVAAPQLHFEIRKGSSPIDPLPLLEKGGNT